MVKTANKSEAPSRLHGQFVSVPEAAELLRISPVSIRRYLRLKKLRRFKVGARTLLSHDEVLGLIHEAQ